MEAELRTQVAFHLTGKRPGADLEAVEGLGLAPVLFAGYRDLTRLRYDFPLVLVHGGDEKAYVQALSGVIDRILNEIARGDDTERLSRHLLRQEEQIRMLAAEGMAGTLTALWDAAAGRLGSRADPALQDSLTRARAALKIDGEVVDCDAALANRLLSHAARVVHLRKVRQFQDQAGRLTQKLADILRADFARSEAGRTAESLKASFGTTDGDAFDFEAMSRLLGSASPKAAMPESRRNRIRSLLSVFEAQRFYPVAGERGKAVAPYDFVFTSCIRALAAYRERLPEVAKVARAIAVAELEIAGDYQEARHDAFFEGFGDAGLDPKDLAIFPDYLVCTAAAELDAGENATLMEILSAGLPMKVLIQTDDILDESQLGDWHLGFGARSRQLANMAIGLNEVYVLQSAASNLFQFRDRIMKGLAFPGAVLVSVFSGARGEADDLPPYLTAAAAMESRAFPAYTYDPAAGSDWASRFDLGANPQVGEDWPIHRLEYEDPEHQRVVLDLAFTLVDFAACDRRYARHFARVPRAKWSANMVPAGKGLGREATGQPDTIPCLLMVDREDRLQKVIVDDRLMREARRCRDLWHSLQELGGVNNSHAARSLAREQLAREEEAKREAKAAELEPKPVAVAPAAAPGEAPATTAPEKPSDDPYIDTASCTTCGECTQLNDKMFAYNENQQAYIANPDAGTFAQLVEAAESCQVAIIHPGKPRNADEPGLEDLIARAEAFR
jgi:ferredoxin